MRDPWDHNNAELHRESIYRDRLKIENPRVIQMAGLPSSLVVSDRRTMRSVDPQPGMGEIRVDRPVRPDENMDAYDPRIMYQMTKLGYVPRDLMIVENVREMRREGTFIRGIGQQGSPENLKDGELVDLLTLASLQSILFINADRASSWLASMTIDGTKTSAAAAAARVNTDPAIERDLKIFQEALLSIRAQVPKFRAAAREAFDGADMVAKLLQQRGYTSKWFAIAVSPEHPEGSLTRAQRNAPGGKVVDLQDPLLVSSFEETFAESEALRARVKESLVRVGFNPNELGLGPAAVILILGLALITAGAATALILMTPAAIAVAIVMVKSAPQIARAIERGVELGGTAAVNAAKGLGIVLPILAGVGVLVVGGAVYALFK